MPEGDTVWRACRRLDEVLHGRLLSGTEFRVPALATTDLAGIEVLEVVSRGKHQLFRFGNGYTLHSHFRMEGTYRIFGADHAGRQSRRWPGGPEFEIRAIISTIDHDCVGFRLPVLELIPTADEDQVVGHLGPDLLGDDWDLDEALRRVTSDPQRSIGEALLDQRNLAGIGTFYRSELLFLQGVHPRTPVGQVTRLPRMLQRAHQLLYANRWRPEQTTTGDLRANARCYVFERVRQPCRRCRTPIRTEEFGPLGQERRSYWCPRCQPAP